MQLQSVAEWNYVEQCVDDGCSAFVGLIDGHVWVARNNDMFVPGVWGHATVREITGRIPTLTFGQEGDVFTATGVNRERLWLHHHALTASDAPRPGRPHMSGWVLLSEMLERARRSRRSRRGWMRSIATRACSSSRSTARATSSRSSSAGAAPTCDAEETLPGWSWPTTPPSWMSLRRRVTRARARRGWRSW